MYRPNAKTGDGGLGDAIRYELKKSVGGKSHIKKGLKESKILKIS